ncbi:MAG TPA: hypothetical protein VKA21_12000, partial [Candidatus Binatia bacterium]|nr:hypothetical protein [Candidatus Binatia bacterium]
SDEPWTREAAAVFAKWPAPRAKGARPRFAPPRCFRDACVVTVEYASVAQYETFDRSFPASEGFAAWPGIRYRTAPVARPDGTLAADWVLYRPSGDAR